MAAKLGPRFAVKARFVPEWNSHAQTKQSLCVVEDAQSWSWILEIHDEAFLNRLSQSPDVWHWIYLAQVLKEDEESLFAFETLQQRQLFILIKELPSLGPKKAAGLLGGLGVDGIRALLFGENPKMFKVNGVGPKGLAQFAQGLQHHKDKFLPVLASAGDMARTDETMSDRGQIAADTTVTKEKPKSRITLSPALLKGLERLGISSEDAFTLYHAIVSDGVDLSELNQAELLQKMLMKWGERSANRSTFEGVHS